jgi:hypothetical protein
MVDYAEISAREEAQVADSAKSNGPALIYVALGMG